MYERYAGLIFDMDGTILDTEPTHRQAWNEVLGRYGMRFDEQAMVALNGSPTWRIAQAIIDSHQADLDPHLLQLLVGDASHRPRVEEGTLADLVAHEEVAPHRHQRGQGEVLIDGGDALALRLAR